MRSRRRGRSAAWDFPSSGEDSFVAVVVTKLTGALLFILMLSMVILALIPRSDPNAEPQSSKDLGPVESVASPIQITTPARLPDAVEGRPYRLALASRGGRADSEIEWGIDGSLPIGLTLDQRLGILEGIPGPELESESDPTPREEPTVVGFEVEVSDGHSRDRRRVRLTILPAIVNTPSTHARVAVVPTWEHWLRHGFGFLVLLAVHSLAIRVVGQTRSPRVSAARWIIRVASVIAAGSLAIWIGYLQLAG